MHVTEKDVDLACAAYAGQVGGNSDREGMRSALSSLRQLTAEESLSLETVVEFLCAWPELEAVIRKVSGL